MYMYEYVNTSLHIYIYICMYICLYIQSCQFHVPPVAAPWAAPPPRDRPCDSQDSPRGPRWTQGLAPRS